MCRTGNQSESESGVCLGSREGTSFGVWLACGLRAPEVMNVRVGQKEFYICS